MILARGGNDEGGQALIVGLSRGNIERLVRGMPIRMTRETHGEGVPEGWSIFILFGETEQAIADELQKIGAIDDAQIKHEPKLGRNDAT